jgi:hypothetical protein
MDIMIKIGIVIACTNVFFIVVALLHEIFTGPYCDNCGWKMEMEEHYDLLNKKTTYIFICPRNCKHEIK